MSNILWLLPKAGINHNNRGKVQAFCSKAGFNPYDIIFTSIWTKVSNFGTPKGKSRKFEVNYKVKAKIEQAFDDYISQLNPSIIVLNDEITLQYVVGSKVSQHLSQGSIYYYRGIPCIVIEDLNNLHGKKYNHFIFKEHIGKLYRWYTGTQHREPKFNYTVCRIVDDVKRATEILTGSFAFSIDCETKDKFCTSIQYTCEHEGRLQTFVIPFFNHQKNGGCHWETFEEELEVWELVKKIHASPVIKTMQGGIYDCAYFLRYNIPPVNYLLDSMYLMHCILAELEKKLNFISHIFLDFCRYWKDEKKGEQEDSYGETAEDLERYWRYGALDAHYTFLDTVRLCQIFIQPKYKWALDNFDIEFRGAVGPALFGSMHGVKINEQRRYINGEIWLKESQEALDKLKVMTDFEDFNPKSPQQVAILLYDILGAKPLKTRGKKKYGARSVDETILKILQTQHPIFDMYIEQIWKYKKPQNNFSKYVDMKLFRGRLLYMLNPAGTWTGRFSCSNHQFWVGTQIQNMPAVVREMCVADEGFIFFEPDYSQSDAKFIAYECEDEKYIETMDSGKDTHAIHGEHFYGMPYKEIVEGHAIDADWTDHPTKGVRQNTKRIVHGSNFQMMGFTLYLTIGHEAAVGSAETSEARIEVYQTPFNNNVPVLIHKTKEFNPPQNWTLKHTKYPANFSRNELVGYLDDRLDSYHYLYPGLRPWFKSSAIDAANNNNLVTCAFGRTHRFFGNLEKDKDVQRQISSFYGQGGTAGNINRTLLEIFYETDLIWKHNILFVTQTHDSILWLIPLDKLWARKNILTIMEKHVTIHGREMSVPSEGKIGFSWGKGLIKDNGDDDVDLGKVRKVEQGLFDKYLKLQQELDTDDNILDLLDA